MRAEIMPQPNRDHGAFFCFSGKAAAASAAGSSFQLLSQLSLRNGGLPGPGSVDPWLATSRDGTEGEPRRQLRASLHLTIFLYQTTTTSRQGSSRMSSHRPPALVAAARIGPASPAATDARPGPSGKAASGHVRALRACPAGCGVGSVGAPCRRTGRGGSCCPTSDGG